MSKLKIKNIVKKHLHKYIKIKYKTGHEIYKCILPECSSFIACELAIGKRNICHKCGNEFILTNSTRVKPHCDNCYSVQGFKKKTPVTEVDIDFLTGLLEV